MKTPQYAKNPVYRKPGLSAATGLGGSTIYDYIKRGLLPPAVRISPKMAVWPCDEIDKITAARIRGEDDEAIRALVSAIVADRVNRT